MKRSHIPPPKTQSFQPELLSLTSFQQDDDLCSPNSPPVAAAAEAANFRFFPPATGNSAAAKSAAFLARVSGPTSTATSSGPPLRFLRYFPIRAPLANSGSDRKRGGGRRGYFIRWPTESDGPFWTVPVWAFWTIDRSGGGTGCSGWGDGGRPGLAGGEWRLWEGGRGGGWLAVWDWRVCRETESVLIGGSVRVIFLMELTLWFGRNYEGTIGKNQIHVWFRKVVTTSPIRPYRISHMLSTTWNDAEATIPAVDFILPLCFIFSREKICFNFTYIHKLINLRFFSFLKYKNRSWLLSTYYWKRPLIEENKLICVFFKANKFNLMIANSLEEKVDLFVSKKTKHLAWVL